MSQSTKQVPVTPSGVNWVGLYTFIRREVERTFRVVTQTLVSPLISAALYIFIFGFVIGSRIDLIAGVPYITFVFPGILMMNIISAAFMSSSSALYFARFIKSIEEVLVAPFSHIEMIIGYVVSAVIRALLISIGVLLIGIAFGAVGIESIWLFLFYTIAVSTIFALIGLLVGLWANGFEQLNILNTFVILPFSFLGGIFYSVEMLPEQAQFIAYANPFFYFIDGIRGSMIGVSEANSAIGLALIAVLIVGLGTLTTYLFSIGWRIRT